MCGLVVFTKPVSNPTILAAIHGMQHRGILGMEGFARHGPYSFAHTRLPIQGLDQQYNQPMFLQGETGVFVGEVFNFTDCPNDAYTALETLITEGPLAAKQFDGFFATAYTRGDYLHIQTDHLGIKPLYYDEENGIIASEIKTLLAIGNYQVDEQFFSNTTKWGYDPSGRTPLRRVKRIPAGTLLTFKGGKLKDAKKYWDIATEAQFHSLDVVLGEAVERRVKMSDVPVATLCSGGLDSTIITLLAQKVKPDIQVFHILDDGPDTAAFNLVREKIPDENIN